MDQTNNVPPVSGESEYVNIAVLFSPARLKSTVRSPEQPKVNIGDTNATNDTAALCLNVYKYQIST